MSTEPNDESIDMALRRALEGKHFPDIASAQAFADTFMHERNRRPIAAFLGLSPEQMNGMLYTPLEIPALVTVQQRIPLEQCTHAPLVALFLMLAEAIGEKGIKPTAKGNLPRELSRELAAMYAERFAAPDRIRRGAIASETDCYPVHVTRVLGQVAGLIRRYKGRFILSRKCRDLLGKNDGQGVYVALFSSYVREFNWAYWDYYPALPFIQHSFLFSLYVLHLHGAQRQPLAFYEDAFLRAFPMILREVPLEERRFMSEEETVRQAYSWRCVRRFMVFLGLAQCHVEQNPDATGYGDRYTTSLSSTPLLDALLQFHTRP